MAATDRDSVPSSVPSRLAITVTVQGTTTTIALTGEWDLAEEQPARRAIREALSRAPECLVLDLSQLTFIDSSGIHVVDELHQRTLRESAHLVIVPGSRTVRRPFEIVGLADVLPFLTTAA
jgi:anti-anti-sigma factor